jgi:tRNA pseudouridine38-40 synthase
LGINAYLPKDICIRWIKPVAEDFHARFSAIARTYQYVILNTPTRSALWHQRATLYYLPLDEKRMREAAQYFIGEQDFSSFRAAECQARTPVRKVHYFTVERQKEFITFEVQANAFLHHMVRNMTGILLAVGTGKQTVDCIPDILAFRDRTKAGITAPPQGLYLTEVIYPDHFGLNYTKLPI